MNSLQPLYKNSMLHQGSTLKSYEIHSVIGRGGFGIVYKGRHQELGIDVAIKEYFPQELSVRKDGRILPSKPEFQASFEDGLIRFLREAQQLDKFKDCPNIVTCRDLFRANGTAYTVMEYVSGLPLSVLLEKREFNGEPLTEQELLELILPLLRGLQTVHESGVCHRDIKPSNILVRRVDAAPILIDFGAAKHEISKHTKSFAPYTDGYASLEQVGEGKIGPWTDIYGLGAVMWRIVAGGAPLFSPPNPPSSQKRALAQVHGETDPLPSARKIGKQRFSNRILDAIDNCLILNIDKRVQDCGELLERLNELPSLVHEEKSDTGEVVTEWENTTRTVENWEKKSNRALARYLRETGKREEEIQDIYWELEENAEDHVSGFALLSGLAKGILISVHLAWLENSVEELLVLSWNSIIIILSLLLLLIAHLRPPSKSKVPANEYDRESYKFFDLYYRELNLQWVKDTWKMYGGSLLFGFLVPLFILSLLRKSGWE